MVIQELESIEGAARAEGLAVMIDVFRACSTACAIVASRPAEYLLVGDDVEARRLRSVHPSALLVGKAEPGAGVCYHLPNSPTHVLQASLTDRVVVHRTMAGVRGVLAARRANETLCASFPNVTATARYILGRRPDLVSLVALGHRGTVPSSEDAACSRYLRALLEDGTPVAPDRVLLRATSGREFFSGLREYPIADFDFCLEIDSFNFALCARRRGGHAVIEVG
jgi:2-phosphosulfolactate phosphatase